MALQRSYLTVAQPEIDGLLPEWSWGMFVRSWFYREDINETTGFFPPGRFFGQCHVLWSSSSWLHSLLVHPCFRRSDSIPHRCLELLANLPTLKLTAKTPVDFPLVFVLSQNARLCNPTRPLILAEDHDSVFSASHLQFNPFVSLKTAV